jgi:hypothetical protein
MHGCTDARNAAVQECGNSERLRVKSRKAKAQRQPIMQIAEALEFGRPWQNRSQRDAFRMPLQQTGSLNEWPCGDHFIQRPALEVIGGAV